MLHNFVRTEACAKNEHFGALYAPLLKPRKCGRKDCWGVGLIGLLIRTLYQIILRMDSIGDVLLRSRQSRPASHVYALQIIHVP